MMLIELIKNNDCPNNEEMEEDDDVLDEEEFRGDHFNKFPIRIELAYHKYLMSAPIPSMILSDPIIMLHKIEQYDSRLDMEKENTESVYFRNEEDNRKGVEYVMSKILWFYKEFLELGPEYRIGPEESSSGSDVDDQGGVT
ncbi:hypothetical protein Tco_0319490 [Tanacetum coccineum]